MIYLAFDNFFDNAPVCGGIQQRNRWDRTHIIARLLQFHPTRFALAHTSKLLAGGVRFAYVLSWRFYFEYGTPMSAERQRERILEAFAFLKDSPILPALRENKAKLVFADWYEGDMDVVSDRLPAGNDYKFQVLAEFLNIPIKSIVFAHGNAAAAKACSPTSPNYVYENIFEYFAWCDAFGRSNSGTHFAPHPLDKPYRFLSYARHWNEYRQYLTLEYFARGLDKFGLFSCGNPLRDLTKQEQEGEMSNALWQWVANDHEKKQLLPLIPDFVKRLPITLDYDLNINLVSTVTYEHYLQTDLTILNETWVNDRFVFLSEKTFKTMSFRHPFLMMGNPGSLAHLRELGYKTFAPYLDESYDDERHLPTRKNKVLQALTDFCNLSTEKRVEIRARLDEIAEHNYRRLMDLPARNTFGQNLVDFLSNALEREYLGAV